MDHVAIMKASWGMTEKIARGEKTIESRWFKMKARPWDRVNPGDMIYFKDTGKPVTVRAIVEEVRQAKDADGASIIREFGDQICLQKAPTGKSFVILIFLKDPERVPPFQINKQGFGSMAAWLTVDTIEKIKM